MDLKNLARLGAVARIKELEAELAELRQFVKGEAVTEPKARKARKTRKRKMSPEAREAARQRMKKYWAEKRKKS